MADGGGGDVQVLRRFGDRTGFRHFNDVIELLHIHVTQPSLGKNEITFKKNGYTSIFFTIIIYNKYIDCRQSPKFMMRRNGYGFHADG